MTDKQIIIDGVDVSGCAHYDKNADKEALFLYDCKREHAPYWSCTSMPNCLYKKYKRKEQECEELKSDNLQEVGQLKFAIGTLTAENLHLKELLDMRIEALCDSCKAGSMLPIKCRIYEKTLTEIKEIAENVIKNVSDRCIETTPMYGVHKQILQKISECEVEDEQN